MMLNGRNVGLRAVEQTDLPILLEWRNEPEFRKYFREYRELGMDQQKEWYGQKVLHDEHTRMFSITDLTSGELLGACGLCYIDWQNQCADFSIYIGKNDLYIDSVYAVDAARVMIQYGFEELNLHRLWTEIYDIDEKKKGFLKILGFIHEATHAQTHWTGGRWVDSWYYRLLRQDLVNGYYQIGHNQI